MSTRLAIMALFTTLSVCKQNSNGHYRGDSEVEKLFSTSINVDLRMFQAFFKLFFKKDVKFKFQHSWKLQTISCIPQTVYTGALFPVKTALRRRLDVIVLHVSCHFQQLSFFPAKVVWDLENIYSTLYKPSANTHVEYICRPVHSIGSLGYIVQEGDHATSF